ncbi:hypothetical protein MMC34_000625 [Xylographa carneopallida]|nr:hypothetical protein [Xylographa carneopallida]
MSLGRQVPYRSTSLATPRLLVTPRGTLHRFLLYFFAGAQPRASFGSKTTHLSTSPGSVALTQNSVIPEQLQKFQEAQDELRQYVNPVQTLPRASLLEGRRTGDKANVTLDWIFKAGGNSQIASATARDRHVEGFKTLEEALSASPGRSLRDSFESPSASIRRIKTDTIRKEEIQTLKPVSTKHTGSWSYDWGLAFLELKQHYEANGTTIAKSPLVTYNLPINASNNSQVRAQDIQRPKIWSGFTFTAHVKKLAQSRVSRLMQPKLYRNQTTHANAVQAEIMLLFEDEALRPYVTTEAFNIALSFCYKNSNISDARKLFNIMDDAHVTISAQTFNIMLLGAAARKDLHNFTYLLRVMTRRGVSPDGDTWIAFLMAIEDRRVKFLVTRYMREAEMLQDAAMVQSVVNEIIDVELSCHLAGDRDLESFVLLMDSRYGPHWLSVQAGNQMCYVLRERGAISQAAEVLGIMADHGCKPDNVTLHIFLGHCRRLRHPQRAIKLLQQFKNLYNVSPNENDYDSLFMLAWRSKLVNCCRIIWRVACLETALSYRMQELVLRSLLRNTPEYPQTTAQRFLKMAGKVVVGIDIQLGTDPEESDPRWKLMQLLSQFSSTGTDRQRSLSLAKQIVARDLDAARHYTLAGSFIDLFAEALALDRSWHNEETEQKPLMWKLQHALDVTIDLHAKPAIRTRRRKSQLVRTVSV